MNERIRNLYIQAINDTKHHPADDINTQIAEKFAELIVRECARVAAQTPCPYDDEDARKTFGHTWDMACVESARNIRKHFGVEE